MSAVTQGSRLLDRLIPEWWEKINIVTLDMYNGRRCILGQLYGNYGDGVGEVFSTLPGSVWKYPPEYGFDIRGDKNEWTDEILARRSQPSPRTRLTSTGDSTTLPDATVSGTMYLGGKEIRVTNIDLAVLIQLAKDNSDA
jgi:hypothetical protein